MNLYWIAFVASLLAGPVAAQPPGQVWQPAAAAIGPKCDATITAARHDISQLEHLPLSKVNKQNVLLAWNHLDILLQEVGNPIYLFSEVSPVPEVRKAAEACVLKMSGLENELYQSAALYARLKAVKASDPIDQTTIETLLEQFEDSGVNLPKDKRAQARKIFDRLDKLQQDFARNLRDNQTKLTFRADELAGVPAEFLAQEKRDAEGRYLVGFDYPEIDAIMGYAESGATRQRYYYDMTRRGTEQNLVILREVVQLRKQLAGLLGYPSYARWSLRRKMVQNPETVNSFLNEVESKVEEVEKRELATLAEEKGKQRGQAGKPLERWDVTFYQQRLKKERYAIDPQIVRAQFPTEPTVAWLLNVTSQLYGIEFRANPNLPVWHPEVLRMPHG